MGTTGLMLLTQRSLVSGFDEAATAGDGFGLRCPRRCWALPLSLTLFLLPPPPHLTLMALFRRNRGRTNDEDGADAAPKKEKGSWRKPASTYPQRASVSALLTSCTRILDTAFKQQRLKAWQPILTPKTVLPTLLIIGLIFAPIGGLLVWGSGLVRGSILHESRC